MLIRYGYEISFNCLQPTPMMCLLDIHPERSADIIHESFFAPGVQTSIFIDHFGNRCRRFVAPSGDSLIAAHGVIDDDGARDAVPHGAMEIPVAQLPDDCLIYLLGSRYCETDKLSQTAWNLFGHTAQGYGRVKAIFDFVHNHITFGYPFARSTRTAFEAYQERVGVCRDFAHLALTLCRCMNIPARYVNGYMGDIGVAPNPSPMDFNAWVEVYIGGQWHTFDARHNQPRIGRIVVARGRDAADIPLVNSFGPHFLKSFKVWTEEVENTLPDEAASFKAPGAIIIGGLVDRRGSIAAAI